MKSKPVVIGIGELVWDMLPSGPQFGGAPINFAYYAHECGADTHIITAVGADELGDKAKQIIAINGLDLTYIQTLDQTCTGRVNVTVDADGQPEYDIEKGSAWDQISATDEALELVSRADCICWGLLAQRSEKSKESILKLLDAAPATCVKVFDINIRQHYYSRELIDESLKRADILKLNEDEFKILSELFGITEGCLATELISHFGLSTVILTCGASCSMIYDRSGLISKVDTPKVKVADTIGAGDSFTATFVTDILMGVDIKSAHEHAVTLSASVCEHKGAIK